MKFIKYILSFLLLLILQLSFAKSSVNVFACEGFGVFNIGYSETPNSAFSESGFRENHIFEQSFLEVISSRSLSFCGGYGELVDSWKKIENLGDNAFDQLRKDPDFLKKFDEVANDADLNKHIFNGEPQLDGDLLRGVSGVHSNKNLVPSSQTTGLNRGDVRIQPDTKVDLGKGYYEAKVQVYGDKGASGGTYVDDWVKGKKSTFFPDAWSPEKVQAEIANGVKNKVPDPDFPTSNGNTAFKATMTDGTKLQMVYNGDKLISAFPNLR